MLQNLMPVSSAVNVHGRVAYEASLSIFCPWDAEQGKGDRSPTFLAGVFQAVFHMKSD